MRTAKVQIIALGFLLVCFMSAGAALIGQNASPEGHDNFVLWLLGLPLGVFGGFALGFVVRGQKESVISHRRSPVQYIVVEAQQSDSISEAVSMQGDAATEWDKSKFRQSWPAKHPHPCRARFRPASLPNLRANQLREN